MLKDSHSFHFLRLHLAFPTHLYTHVIQLKLYTLTTLVSLHNNNNNNTATTASDDKRGQNLEAEANFWRLRPRPRPKIIMKKLPNND